MPSELSISNAPTECARVYDRHRFARIAEGVDPDKAHKFGLRMLHEAGWYKGHGGKWKKLHADLTDKIAIRDAVKQPDGKYVIEDVDVFYPNAVKDGDVFDADRIGRLIENTNRAINSGGQQPALLEGHTSPIDKLLSNQKRSMGYPVNWRKHPDKPGFVRCDLVKVEPEFIEKQKTRPLTGLSPGIVSDAGGLNERFDHVAVLGSSLQALSALPRMELSEMYGSDQVCFSADSALNFYTGVPMPTLNEDNKKAAAQMADCYAAYSAAMKSFAAGEPHSWEKLQECGSKMKTHYESNKTLFESMPDEPLVSRAKASLTKQPTPGTAVRKDDQAEKALDESDHDSNFESDDAATAFSAEQRDQAKRIGELEGMLAKAVGKLTKQQFSTDLDSIRREGVQLPESDKIDKMYEVCFASEDPASAIDSLLAMFKAGPRSATAAGMGTVLGAAGASAVPGKADEAKTRASTRTLYNKALGANFSSESIEFGPKFMAEMEKRLAKA